MLMRARERKKKRKREREKEEEREREAFIASEGERRLSVPTRLGLRLGASQHTLGCIV